MRDQAILKYKYAWNCCVSIIPILDDLSELQSARSIKLANSLEKVRIKTHKSTA